MSSFIRPSTIHGASDPVAYLRALLAKEPVELLTVAIKCAGYFETADELVKDVRTVAESTRYLHQCVGVSRNYEYEDVSSPKYIDAAYDVIAEIWQGLDRAYRYAAIQRERMEERYCSAQAEFIECVIVHRLFDGRPGLLDTFDDATGKLVRDGVYEIAVDIVDPKSPYRHSTEGLLEDACFHLDERIADFHDLTEFPEYAAQCEWLAVFGEYDAHK